jgi:hypothetical protein
MTLTPKTAPSQLSQELPGGFLEVLLLAFPAMLTHLSEALMGVVDSAPRLRNTLTHGCLESSATWS